MADSDALISGGGTVKKNIHWFIGGAIGLVIVVAIFMQDSSARKEKAEKEKEQPEVVEPVFDKIDGMLDSQKNAMLPTDEKPTVPAVAMEGVGTSAKQSEEISAAEAQAIEDARREAQTLGSAIMVIGSQNGPLDNLAELKMPVEERQTGLDINEAVLRAALAPAPAGEQEPVAPKVLSKEEQDQDWLDQQAKRNKTNPITEDTMNAPYTIFEGTVIPAVLMTKVTSQLPGQVTGVVSQDVYDSVTGNHIIIPKGSTVYGTYNNSIVQGQSRLTVAFKRLILPNGRTVSLLGMPGADKVGQHGIEGDVDNRYLQRFGFSFFTAVLGAIVDKNNTQNTTIINTDSSSGTGISTAAGTILTDISRQEQQRNNQIRPIVTIKQGQKFNINVNRDISIAPYM